MSRALLRRAVLSQSSLGGLLDGAAVSSVTDIRCCGWLMEVGGGRLKKSSWETGDEELDGEVGGLESCKWNSAEPHFVVEMEAETLLSMLCIVVFNDEEEVGAGDEEEEEVVHVDLAPDISFAQFSFQVDVVFLILESFGSWVLTQHRL